MKQYIEECAKHNVSEREAMFVYIYQTDVMHTSSETVKSPTVFLTFSDDDVQSTVSHKLIAEEREHLCEVQESVTSSPWASYLEDSADTRNRQFMAAIIRRTDSIAMGGLEFFDRLTDVKQRPKTHGKIHL
jgi:hypothetical protein